MTSTTTSAAARRTTGAVLLGLVTLVGAALTVVLAVAHGADRLVLDLDRSVVDADRRVLASAGLGPRGVVYAHLPSAQDPLLWIADAVAWCEARGDRWSESVRPLIVERIRV